MAVISRKIYCHHYKSFLTFERDTEAGVCVRRLDDSVYFEWGADISSKLIQALCNPDRKFLLAEVRYSPDTNHHYLALFQRPFICRFEFNHTGKLIMLGILLHGQGI